MGSLTHHQAGKRFKVRPQGEAAELPLPQSCNAGFALKSRLAPAWSSPRASWLFGALRACADYWDFI